MTSIIFEKRKLCEAIEEVLQINPASYEVKKRINEHGEYRELYESLLPQLKTLFPEQSDDYLLETLKYHKNDILSTIEYLKYPKPKIIQIDQRQSSAYLDHHVLEVLNELSACTDRTKAYNILAEFKDKLVGNNQIEHQRIEAENYLLRKTFRIQKNILWDENLKMQRSEDMLSGLYKELERSKDLSSILFFKLEQLEKNCNQNLRNNDIY